ncbi:hypothetical protein K505DRAFT_330660 [Melanomma pulvis-pyrius CBS 109.77]|uniref:AB hydrolase-1 domain-containing protein n=1 Tax=Melanomma pulvis-pyrius CBS 109.77 TaxID=1314802 RepID=A0A6A6WQ14_9PLEO|nr:hypothetical protein K505DRAFT_330660 [Melanomma pulvis-pyrius CBS 109.77]
MTSPSHSPPPGYSEYAQPPALPPRAPRARTPAPAADPSLTAMASHDPRSSSTQSLVPDPASDSAGRRRLLLVYIHGFMGNETSFQSFPAHVHNLVTITLADSHIVHTKIYPRYRSRHALEVARDDFSKWLAPHETPLTDVILLGHSMGGLLAADITLVFRHHIIGVVNFDVPFIGMHPGIVKAGLGSIFNPSPTPEHQAAVDMLDPSAGKRPSRMNTLFNPKPSDPNYNPRFANDVQLPVRKGWENTLHFINKHSNGLIEASKDLVKSHFEFGSAMADYRELKDRYARIRALEEDDESKRKSANPAVPSPPRIRFINYYTASTGRPKKPKSPKSPKSSKSPSPSRSASRQASSSTSALVPGPQLAVTTKPASPRISVEEYRDDEVVPVSPEEPLSAIDPMPMEDQDESSQHEETSPPKGSSIHPEPSLHKESTDTESGPELPEIPPIPVEPAFVDLAQYPDKAERKAAEKDHSRALKEYEKAVKARNQVIKERHKITEKWQKEKQKAKQREAAAALKEAEKQREVDQPTGEALRLKEEAARMEREAARMRGEHTPPSKDASENENETEETNIESSFGATQLGPESHPQARKHNSPYSNYDYSRSIILDQARPDDHTSSNAPSLSTNTSYADSTTTLTTQDTNTTTTTNPDADSETPPKKKRFKKFCMLPPKDANGNKDPTWVRVFMDGMDEVTAHTSLFFMSETYERLVGDVVARIEDWVREAESMRVVREMEGLA